MKNTEVSLFIPCLIDSMYPQVGEAVVQVLRKAGVDLDYPPQQTCCGLPPFNSGYRKKARIAAKRFIEIFENSNLIVCPSGSCVKMVRHHYLELFKEDPKWLARAKSVGEKTYEFSEYLVDVLQLEEIEAAYRGKVTYHDTCSLLRGLGVKEQPRKLIRMVDGIEYVEMENSERCCGFGGTFSVKYPVISTAMLEEKIKNITNCGVDAVVGCDMSCLMNIQGMLSRQELPIKTLHIAQLLCM